ncbi:pilus assembly protein HicB [Candidatus Magnetominusculus xianensis]|uniref:Pilus biosynthesis protein HicB n=1 Tax=Candidatus Magnetominusculus xianensis TaxID=1748249 RepID=A0ABR5SE32_9BACT|nr:pilus assembly protein HicB [Candidatus Magnetominusculus xianensis]KWT84012.1 pilus biosynthesis protein HicB [Candidatus Magnetominusculus xianensis]MBF0405388.1 pilus assembly protein HicB [Nitrospirota bacterium]
MKKSDRYHKWVEWSEEDHVYIGKCPDLITGIHGGDPVALYSELCETVEEVINHFEMEGRVLPAPRIRPMQEVM